MTRIALVQMLFKPAIIDKEIDHLAEPALIDGDCLFALSNKLNNNESNQLDAFRCTLRDAYIGFFTQKLSFLCKEISKHSPDIIVFPEYSIPFQCLPYLKTFSQNNKTTIIAGTHTVSKHASDYYDRSLLSELKSEEFLGYSVCPVFIPGGEPSFQFKNTCSKYEQSMRTPSSPEQKVFRIKTRDGRETSFSVLICADAFALDSPANIRNPKLMIITAYSSGVEAFEGIQKTLSVNGIPSFVCNAGLYGGTGLLLPPHVGSRIRNVIGNTQRLEKGLEAVMFIDIDETQLFDRRGITESSCLGAIHSVPIIYKKESKYLKDQLDVIKEIKSSLEARDSKSIADWVDFFLSEYKEKASRLLLEECRSLKSAAIDGVIDYNSSQDALSIICIDDYSTNAFFYDELKQAGEFCIKLDSIPDDNNTLDTLRKERKKYPKAEILSLEYIITESIIKPPATVDQLSSFRDRADVFDDMVRTFMNKEIKIVLVSGAYGIGKTTAVQCALQRVLPHWDSKMVSLPDNVRFANAIEYISPLVNTSISADTFSRVTDTVAKCCLEQLAKKLLAKRERVIIIDQLESITKDMNPSDVILLKFFADAVCSTSEGEGKIMLISDKPFPYDIFPLDSPAIRRITIGGINERKHIERILTYEFNKRKATESPTSIPDFLYDLIGGHPLTAKLCVEIAIKKGISSMADIDSKQMRGDIINELMTRVSINETQQQLLSIISVFRTAINTDLLCSILSEEHKKLFHEKLYEIQDLPFMCIWEDKIELTSVFRAYYYDQICEESKNEYHAYALAYYKSKHNELKEENKYSPIVFSELAYHLVKLGRMDELSEYLPGNITTLKDQAKQLYKIREYNRAFDIYTLINAAFPDDPEVLSYLGRCEARNGNWPDANKHFEEAISAAKSQRRNTWYLYRDWGHMNIRSEMRDDAALHFRLAREYLVTETGKDDDAGILAGEGYAYELESNLNEAKRKYVKALELNPYHEFTIDRYSTILDKENFFEKAAELRSKLDRYELEYTATPFDIIEPIVVLREDSDW